MGCVTQLSTSPPSTVPSAEGVLRRLELTITRKLDGLVHGDHEGLVPGPGSENGGGRRYEPGDDVRRIDWNLTARSSEVQVRTTIADRELETWFVVDGTASLDFGTARYEKRWLAMTAVAAFGFLAARGGNRVGAVVFDGDGSILMNLGGLTTLARYRPTNLVHIVFDNGNYSNMGPTATTRRTDLERMAQGAGIQRTATLRDDDAFGSALRAALEGAELTFLVAKVERDRELPFAGNYIARSERGMKESFVDALVRLPDYPGR